MKKHYLFHSKFSRGFTLVEMLIYLNLLSLLLIFISRIFLTTLDVQVRSQSSSAVQIDDQFLLSRLQYDVYRADAITLPVNIGDLSNSLVMQIGGDTFTYSISGGQLQLTNSMGTQSVNSNRTSISNFSVEKLGNLNGFPTVKVGYTITSLFLEDGTPESRTNSIVLGNR